MKTKNHNNGFSTTELVIVVLILAIIAVLLTPQVIKWIRSSRQNSDVQLMDTSKAYADLALDDDDAREESTEGIKIHIDESGMTISGNNGQDIEDFANKYAEVAGINPGDLVPAGPSSYTVDTVKPKDKDTVIDININGGQVAASSNIDNDDIDNTHETEVADNDGGGSLPGGGGNGGGNTPGGNGEGGNTPGGNGEGGNTPGGNGEGGNTPGGNGEGGNTPGGEGGNTPGGEGGNTPGGEGGNTPGGNEGGNTPGGEGGNTPGGNEGESSSIAISLDKYAVSLMKKGQEALTVTIADQKSTDVITWESKDTNIVTINSTGNICGLTASSYRAGTTEVVVTVTRGKDTATKSCSVTVSEGTQISLSPASASILVGQDLTIQATRSNNDSRSSWLWTSDNEAVIAPKGSTTSNKATFNAVSAGTATVTCTYRWSEYNDFQKKDIDYSVYATCTVEVKDGSDSNVIVVTHYVGKDVWKTANVTLDDSGYATVYDESIVFDNIILDNDSLAVSKEDKEVHWKYRSQKYTLQSGGATMPSGSVRRIGQGAYHYLDRDVCKNRDKGNENALMDYSESYDGEHAYAVIEKNGREWTLEEYKDVGPGSYNTKWQYVQTFKIIVGKDFATER